MTIKDPKPEDSGVWTCHMEEYVFLGGRGSGATAEGRINVTVQATTTTAPSTTTTTTITAPTTPPATTPSTPVSTSSKETVSTTTQTSSQTNLSSPEMKPSSPEMKPFSPETKPYSPKTKPTESLSDEDGSDDEEHPEGSVMWKADSSSPEAVPRIEEAGSSTATIIGVICAIILVGVVGVGIFVFQRRRRGPDAAAAVVYEREARSVNDDRSMVPGYGAHIGNRESSINYHEFFPPSFKETSGPASQP
jgi:cobalamin biosynthesis Mg chelatase CobN